MRKLLITLLMPLSLVLYNEPSVADCPPAAVEPTAEMIKTGVANGHDHGFLWRITKDANTGYLYGTIHAAKFDWMFPGPAVQQALAASDTVALELDMLDNDIQARLIKGMQNRHDVVLPAALQERLHKAADALCVPYETLDQFMPEMQAITLSILVGRWDGLESQYAVDIILASIAHAAGKNVLSLETPELQTQILTGARPEEVINTVQDTLNDIESGRARSTLNRLANAWENSLYQELDSFFTWCECLKTESERELMKQMLDDRNPNLADKIDTLQSSGKHVFAAVGSLHFFGDKGLPTLLRERGYRVEQVSF